MAEMSLLRRRTDRQSFFVRLLHPRVLLRMARPHRQAPEPEPAQHRADAALGQVTLKRVLITRVTTLMPRRPLAHFVSAVDK